MESKAQARWTGSLKEGKGTLSTGSGILNQCPYTYATPFENTKGTNPEELIAAAHSSCFSMVLTVELGKAHITPESIETSCIVVLSKQGHELTITDSKLVTTVTAKGADKAKIEAAVASAKENCPVSKLLNAKIDVVLSVNV